MSGLWSEHPSRYLPFQEFYLSGCDPKTVIWAFAKQQLEGLAWKG